jgi:hypothetical protein
MDVRRLRNPLTIAGLATAYYFLTSLALERMPFVWPPAWWRGIWSIALPVSLMTLAESLELLMAAPLLVWIIGAFVSHSGSGRHARRASSVIR